MCSHFGLEISLFLSFTLTSKNGSSKSKEKVKMSKQKWKRAHELKRDESLCCQPSDNFKSKPWISIRWIFAEEVFLRCSLRKVDVMRVCLWRGRNFMRLLLNNCNNCSKSSASQEYQKINCLTTGKEKSPSRLAKVAAVSHSSQLLSQRRNRWRRS